MLVEVHPKTNNYFIICEMTDSCEVITKTPLNSSTMLRQSVEKEIAAVEITKREVASARFLFIPTTG
jgi:hypothetical protein